MSGCSGRHGRFPNAGKRCAAVLVPGHGVILLPSGGARPPSRHIPPPLAPWACPSAARVFSIGHSLAGRAAEAPGQVGGGGRGVASQGGAQRHELRRHRLGPGRRRRSSSNSAAAIASQLMPWSSSTSAFARRARRRAADPSRASSIRSCRDTLSRNPGRIIGPVESNSDPLGKRAGPDAHRVRVYQDFLKSGKWSYE